MNGIVSEDFFDLLVSYDEITPNLGQLLKIGGGYAVQFVPANTIDRCSITRYGYDKIPKCYSLLSLSSLEASNVSAVRNIPNLGLTGSGTLIGILDTGIEYQHSAFKNADGSTRIVSIWDQTINDPSAPPEGFTYGTEYTREQINNALRSAVSLGVVPSVDEVGHGTMIAGVAAGTTSLQNSFSGVAPQSELVVVKLKPAKKNLKNFSAIPEDVLCYAETDIMLGLTYLVNVAKGLGRPIAICIALGTSQGGHDEFGILPSYVSTVSDSIGSIVVVGIGNEGNLSRHFYTTIDPQITERTFELKVGKEDKKFFMELWSSMPSSMSVAVTSPTGEYIAPIAPNLEDCRELEFIFESSIVWVNNIPIESRTGDQLILFRFKNPMEGVWKFTLYNIESLAAAFNVWLPQSDIISRETYFLEPNPNTTITGPSTALRALSITAYNSDDGSIYINSGRGYTRVNAIKPELAAPGVNIRHPALDNSYAVSSGTGVAAAHTTGVAAMLLEWGIVKKNMPYMDGTQIKTTLIRGAKRNPGTIYPNNIYGFGALDLYTAFGRLR